MNNHASPNQLIMILLEKPLSLSELIICRYQVSNGELAQRIEARLLTEPFFDIPEIEDLIRIRGDIEDYRLEEKLHQFCTWIVSQSGYCQYLWAIAKYYPDLREPVGFRFLREATPELPQIAYSMKYFSTELQNALVKKVERYGEPLYLDLLRDPSYA